MLTHAHFIGIGGIGMSALAHLLLDQGVFVSGSDLYLSPIVQALASRGAKIFIGHSLENIHGAERIIYSSGIEQKNPEYQEAVAQSIPLQHRAHFLAEQLFVKKSLLVAGTHGKTTTSSLLAHVLLKAGEDPSFAIGGIAPSLATNGRASSGTLFVAEADESDGSLVCYHPFGAIITNVDDDHLEYWKSREALLAGFAQFSFQVASKEHLFYCADDPGLCAIRPKGYSYGFEKSADVCLSNYRQKGWKLFVDIHFKDTLYQNVEVPLIGRHNALNSAAVFALCTQLGISETLIRESLACFQGVRRRVEKKGEISGITVYDDYAHHPTEIAVTLNAIKTAVGKRRIVVAFQPHRYSRLKTFMDRFASALQSCDVVVLTDVYSAQEAPIPEVTITTLQERIQKQLGKEVHYYPREQLVHFLFSFMKQGDVLVTLGAGDITQVGNAVLESYAK